MLHSLDIKRVLHPWIVQFYVVYVANNSNTCFRSVFGGTVGPKSHPIPANEVKPGGPISQSFYEGIKVRDVPLTINIKFIPVTEVPRPAVKKRPQSTPKPKPKRKKTESPTSPILKAQLISPNKPSSPCPSPSPSPSQVDTKMQVRARFVSHRKICTRSCNLECELNWNNHCHKQLWEKVVCDLTCLLFS